MAIKTLPNAPRSAAQRRPASQPAAAAARTEGAGARPLFIAVVAAGLAALIVWPGLHLLEASLAGSGPIFPVEAVRTGLARGPAVWLHRSLRIRGIASRRSDPSGCPHCHYAQPQLLGASGAGASRALWLEWDPSSPPLLTLLRRLPLGGTLVSSPQRVRWGVMAVYRVCSAPGSPPMWGRRRAMQRCCWMRRPLYSRSPRP